MIHVLENTRIRCIRDPMPNQTGFPDRQHADSTRSSHLRCVVHLDLGDLPVAGLRVVLQPGLAGEEAAHSEHPHTCQQGEEAALPADVLPGQHRQHLPRVRPPHRLIVQGVLLGLPRPGLQLSVRPDLPSHFCDEAKSLLLHHDCLMFSSCPRVRD